MGIYNTKPTTLVGPEGSLDSDIVIVGETVGSSEVKLRRPFQGPAGNLLNECLHAAGIVRSNCYLTNVIKEQPYKNDISQFISLRKKVPVVSTQA